MRSIKTHLILSTISMIATLGSTTAFADYRLTAFGDSLGYSALIAKDVSTATSLFEDHNVEHMDFLEINNLCVSQILDSEFDAAIESCAAALDLSETDYSVTYKSRREAKASILSNLAVAKALNGDLTGAQSNLEMALSLNSSDRNAIANIDLLAVNLVAGN